MTTYAPIPNAFEAAVASPELNKRFETLGEAIAFIERNLDGNAVRHDLNNNAFVCVWTTSEDEPLLGDALLAYIDIPAQAVASAAELISAYTLAEGLLSELLSVYAAQGNAVAVDRKRATKARVQERLAELRTEGGDE